MIAGDIVESYQGKFAKVTAVGELGLTWLSAWVQTAELAEAETVAVTWLNDFGLSQVLKDGTLAGKSDFDISTVDVVIEDTKEPVKAGKSR